MTHEQLRIALQALRPTADYVIRDGVVEWRDETQVEPTQAELDTALLAYTNMQYYRDRKNAYPDIGDQLDALWKGGEAYNAMLAQIQAVKAAFPKP